AIRRDRVGNDGSGDCKNAGRTRPATASRGLAPALHTAGQSGDGDENSGRTAPVRTKRSDSPGESPGNRDHFQAAVGRRAGAGAELQLVSDDDLSETRKQSAIAQKEVAEAEGKLRVLRAGARPEAVEALEAEIARLEMERQYSRQQLDRVRVVSPAAGVVTTS